MTSQMRKESTEIVFFVCFYKRKKTPQFSVHSESQKWLRNLKAGLSDRITLNVHERDLAL